MIDSWLAENRLYVNRERLSSHTQKKTLNTAKAIAD
jgi:hypothetical protein